VVTRRLITDCCHDLKKLKKITKGQEVLNPGPPEYEAGEAHTDSDERLEAEDQQFLGAVFSGDSYWVNCKWFGYILEWQSVGRSVGREQC